ncbi:hypothetical protein [Tsukamurella asaccharolytica]|uniref:hypothetical protein n=1 Tax=Tsukamurella asaccharolytica TaxID=2592067 RepID=UPI001877D46F|nr:hypothetical protein [Tsukamurella asaccharolytica]
MAQTAAQRAVAVFVSAVEARGGKAEVTTKGSTTLVTVSAAGGRTETLRVKATTGDAWQARKSEATAKAPVTAWALVDLSDGAPIALAPAADYAAHVAKLAAAWEGKNPGKSLTANTNLSVTADAVAAWEDAWALLGLDGAEKPAAEKPAAEKPAAEKPAAAKAAPAKKAPAKKAAPATKATPAAKKAAPAKKAPAKKAPAKKAPAKKVSAKPVAKTTAAKTTATKPAAKKAPVKASEAKITPIAAQNDAASKGKAPASIDAKKPATAPEPKAAPKAKAPSKDLEKAAPQKGRPSGIALLLKRLPVVGRLL